MARDEPTSGSGDYLQNHEKASDGQKHSPDRITSHSVFGSSVHRVASPSCQAQNLDADNHKGIMIRESLNTNDFQLSSTVKSPHENDNLNSFQFNNLKDQDSKDHLIQTQKA